MTPFYILLQCLPPAYVVRGKVMFWHASVHPSICLSTGGGYPYPIMLCNISQNAMRWGGYLGQVPPRGGTRVRYPPGGGVPGSGTPPGGTQVRYPPRGGTRVRYPPRGGYPGQVPPRGGYSGQVPPWGGYPGRTTEGVLTTRRAVCLLRSRRRTFLFLFVFEEQNFPLQ